MQPNALAQSVCSLIDAPGNYIYGGDIHENPTEPNDAAVCVTSSDVVVDIGEHLIVQENMTSGFVGVRVNPGLKNVIIRNGELRNLTGVAISIGEGCQDITIENIKIKNCNESGIVLAGTIANPIKDGIITNCVVSSCTGANGNPAYGIHLLQCDNIEMNDNIINNNDAGATNTGFGISLEFCTSCRIVNCDVIGNGGNTLGAGISFSQSQWCVARNCRIISTVSRDSATSSKAVGILLDSCSHISITDCLSKHTTNLVAQSHGFQALNGSDNIFVLCESQNNLGGTIASGFTLEGTETKSGIFKCKARVNDGGLSGAGYGIFLNGSSTCDIWYNQLIGNKGSLGYGLRDTTTDTTNLIAGNVAFANTTTGFNVPRTTGSFPALTAAVSDFSAIANASKYMNIYFTP
jgi:hypothetical protein